jgi:glycosyltransferase involved in cell wall biosynthesis
VTEVNLLNGSPVHQVAVVAAPNDAVTGSTLVLREILRKHGPSEVFTIHVHPDLAGEVHPYRDYPYFKPAEPDPVTIVHISMGDDAFLPFLAEIPGRFIVYYHNITPSEYFVSWDAGTARMLKLGRSYVTDLQDRVLYAIAASEYSASELRDAGYDDVRVGGLPLDMERLIAIRPAPIPDLGGGPVILSVGQLYPHKRPDLLLAAFHRLVSGYRPDARLVIAGAARMPAFERALTRYVDRLGLASCVTITGEIPEAELMAWFRRADLFVTLSEHEGFCVPLVEAMFLDVPILGRDWAAVPETMGEAGILLPPNTGPTALARVVAAMLENPDALESLRSRGRIRREAFTREACRRRLEESLTGPKTCE